MINGRLTSYDHAKKGVPLTQKLLKRITKNKTLIDAVCKLVEVHLYPTEFIKGHARNSAYKRLALKLAPDVTLAMVALVALADKRGRNSHRGIPLATSIKEPLIDAFLHNAQLAGVLSKIEEPILQGKDLMPEVQPGPDMGLLVKEAYAIQLNEDIKDKEILKKRVLKKQVK
jgi:tRNA nucleotidyltransferase (CCA-adding enzyme)